MRELIYNRRGHSFDLRNWSGIGVAVLVAGVMVILGHTGWAFGFIVLAVVLAMV